MKRHRLLLFRRSYSKKTYTSISMTKNIRLKILDRGGDRTGYRFPPIPHQYFIERVHSCSFAHNISCGLCLRTFVESTLNCAAHARPHQRFVFLQSSLRYRFFQLRLAVSPCKSLPFTSLFPVTVSDQLLSFDKIAPMFGILK